MHGYISSSSMEPGLQDRNYFFANRLAYRFGQKPKRFDVIVFYDHKGDLMIKRVIGLPGEKIRIDNSYIYVDDQKEPLDEFYLNEVEWLSAYSEIEVKPNAYLVMGDNRNHSHDSRFWTNPFVETDAIQGRLWFTYKPRVLFYNNERHLLTPWLSYVKYLLKLSQYNVEMIRLGSIRKKELKEILNEEK